MSKYKSFFKKINFSKLENPILIIGLLLLSLLLFKNPFSERNLISNLEPFPDSFHYIVPAVNLASGNGLFFQREDRNFKIGVPPLYSIYLSPFFLLNKLPQMFYFGNVVLSFISAILFFKLLKKITQSLFITAIVFFFYITNFYIYWFPALAMAENLTLVFFLINLHLIMSSSFKLLPVARGLSAVALYGTKFASLPTAAAFLTVYLIQYLAKKKQQLKAMLIFILSALGLALLLYGYEYFFLNKNILLPIANFLFPEPSQINNAVTSTAPANVWFSSSFMTRNLPIYFDSLMGKPNKFLWEFTPMVPSIIAIPGMVGILIMFFKKKSFFLALALSLTNIATILFMSTFYTTDNRYIFIALPSLLIGFAGLATFALEASKKRMIFLTMAGLLIGIFLIYSLQSAIRIKSQISLNLRYAENPWYYMGAKNFESFFSTLPKTEKPNVFITALPPYYIDFFLTSKPIILPLSYGQDFRDDKPKAWGIDQEVDLIELYKKYLNEGYNVYVSNSALGNESYTNIDFGKINSNFNLVKVKDGCFDTCNIYKVENRF